MLLLIDNFDSFVHNLARYFTRLGQRTVVRRNDSVTVEEVRQMRPAAIVISPGPCTPDEAGVSLELVRQFGDSIPMLGVCLGHQAIAAAYGARIVRANEPVHGRASAVRHDGSGIFASLPNPFTACRYHSLVVEEKSLPAELEVTARTDDGTIMAFAHREWPLIGVQFHPESVLTQGGFLLLANFLRRANLAVPNVPTLDDELAEFKPYEPKLPAGPVTF